MSFKLMNNMTNHESLPERILCHVTSLGERTPEQDFIVETSEVDIDWFEASVNDVTKRISETLMPENSHGWVSDWRFVLRNQ